MTPVVSLPAMVAGTVAVGWATVELERAVGELAHLLVPGRSFSAAPASIVLGARCRVGPAHTPTGLRIVLLEPDTEGRLAATLARNGEGWAVSWVADAGLGARPWPARPGPLGDERLLPVRSAFGPHRLLVEAVPSPS